MKTARRFTLSFLRFFVLFQKGNHIFQAGHHRGGCRQHLLRHRGNIRHHHRPAAGGKARTGAVFRIFQHKAVCGRHIYALCAQQVNIGRRLRVLHHVAAHHGRKIIQNAGALQKVFYKVLLGGGNHRHGAPGFLQVCQKRQKAGLHRHVAPQPFAHKGVCHGVAAVKHIPRGHIFLKGGAAVGQAAAAQGGNLLFPHGHAAGLTRLFPGFVPKALRVKHQAVHIKQHCTNLLHVLPPFSMACAAWCARLL